MTWWGGGVPSALSGSGGSDFQFNSARCHSSLNDFSPWGLASPPPRRPCKQCQRQRPCGKRQASVTAGLQRLCGMDSPKQPLPHYIAIPASYSRHMPCRWPCLCSANTLFYPKQEEMACRKLTVTKHTSKVSVVSLWHSLCSYVRGPSWGGSLWCHVLWVSLFPAVHFCYIRCYWLDGRSKNSFVQKYKRQQRILNLEILTVPVSSFRTAADVPSLRIKKIVKCSVISLCFI